MYLLLVVWAAPALAFLFYSLNDASVLENALINDTGKQTSHAFIAPNANITDIVSDDLLLLSWDLNNRRPRWFTQWSSKNEATVKNMTLG